MRMPTTILANFAITFKNFAKNLLREPLGIALATINLILMRFAIPPYYADGDYGIAHLIFIANEPALICGAIPSAAARYLVPPTIAFSESLSLTLAAGPMVILQWLLVGQLLRFLFDLRFKLLKLRQRPGTR